MAKGTMINSWVCPRCLRENNVTGELHTGDVMECEFCNQTVELGQWVWATDDKISWMETAIGKRRISFKDVLYSLPILLLYILIFWLIPISSSFDEGSEVGWPIGVLLMHAIGGIVTAFVVSLGYFAKRCGK